MQCRLLRDEEYSPNTEAECQTLAASGKLPCRPAGTVINHPDAAMLVRMGIAEPVDEECRLAAGMTVDQMVAAQRAQECVRRGIAPEDYEAFEAGKMVGYDENGDWIPGPNYIAGDDDKELDEDFFDDDSGDSESA